MGLCMYVRAHEKAQLRCIASRKWLISAIQRQNNADRAEKRCIIVSRPNNILNGKSHVYLFIVYGTQQNFLTALSISSCLLALLLTISPSNDGKPLNEMKKCNQHFFLAVVPLFGSAGKGLIIRYEIHSHSS